MPRPSFASGNPNAGPWTHGESRARNPLVSYDIAGTVRWLDRDLGRAVVHVTEANGHAGALLGDDVTVDLRDARMSAPGRPLVSILPGNEVRLRTRLPREMPEGMPDPLPIRSAAVLG